MGNCITSQICCIKTDKKIESVRLENENNIFYKKKKNLSMKISNKSTAQNSIIKRKKVNVHLTVKPKKMVFLESEINHSLVSLKKKNSEYSKFESYDERNNKRKLTFAAKEISMNSYYKKKKLMAKNFLFNEAMGKIHLNLQTSRLYQKNYLLSGDYNYQFQSKKSHSVKKLQSIKSSFEDKKDNYNRKSIKTEKNDNKNNLLLENNNENKVTQEQIEYIESPNTNNKKYKVNENLSKEQMEFIKKVLIDNNLVIDFDEDTINEFIIGFFSFEVESNYTLFEEGEEARVFYIIESGEIILSEKVNLNENNSSNKNKNNNEEIIESTILKDGNFFGIDSFEEGLFRTQKAISNGYTKLLGVSGEFYRSAIIYMNLKIINERVSVLKKTFLFKYLEKNQLVNLSKQMILLEYKPNSIIINENDICYKIFIIANGVVRKTRKFKKIDEIKTGELFCHINFFINSPSYYTYSVDQNPLTVYELTYKTSFRTFLFKRNCL